MYVVCDSNGTAVKFFIQKDLPTELHFIPYTYVEACKIAGMLMKQIFVENGEAIKFHIDSSIANINARAALSARIMGRSLRSHLVKNYQGVPGKYVGSYLWVKRCVEKGTVVYTPLVYKNPGGRRPGEDGRTGNRLYQQLCDMANDPEYTRVTRHTWQSWHERYKKNSQRLDTLIQAIVEQKKPSLGEKGQYGYVRKPEEKPKRSPSNDDDFLQAGPPMGIPIPGYQCPQCRSVGLGVIQDGVVVVRESPAEEEMGDEEAEWGVRVGNDSPPMWGKRKAGEDPKENGKKAKVGEHTSEHPASGVIQRDRPILHVVDQGILDIAREFRFTVEEVQEHYDRYDAMERTRARFKKMRDTLSAADDSDHVA
ncbi:hypothetical protein EDB92DRAFT_1933491 [Lactarius akahatsu]|uniref:TERF2-interacting telomeric protein 1 Myb domain-containing protein n=1 Tax=Lactarius akahatsu TaxID=416441 RepID=A0AAD4LRS6_9AGAM|nr:hypothetical protein EDB92DRAFT_1933491 [Lactarius akahatsu]